MLIEQQIAQRRERAAAIRLRVLKRPANGRDGDYTVKSASGRTYRVAMRGPLFRELLLVSGFRGQYRRIARRRNLYASPAFFNLTSYELVEAQHIRNWTTGTARTIKQLKSRYAFVVTGAPLENKLEELFSVVEFVDGRGLGPAFRFPRGHRVEDEKGRLTAGVEPLPGDPAPK